MKGGVIVVEYVNIKDIQTLHNAANPNHPIGRDKARAIRDECKRRYEAEHGEVFLYNKLLIPKSWYEAYFGEATLNPKMAKRK